MPRKSQQNTANVVRREKTHVSHQQLTNHQRLPSPSITIIILPNPIVTMRKYRLRLGNASPSHLVHFPSIPVLSSHNGK